jgi:hypothetical protein
LNGAGLVEAYDVSRSNFSSFTNLSTRGKVEPDDSGTMIVGFIIAAPSGQPATTQRVLIRARGPSLTSSGLAGVLQDPTMDVYRGLEKVFSNDNWGSQSSPEAAGAADIKATGLAPPNSREPAVLVSLDPGTYTAVIRGKNNSSGIALVEAYRLN